MPANDTDKIVGKVVGKVLSKDNLMTVGKYLALLAAVFLTGSAGVKLTAPDPQSISTGVESVSDMGRDIKAMKLELQEAVLTIKSIAKSMDADKAELERRIIHSEKRIAELEAAQRDAEKRLAKLEANGK